MQTIFGNIDEQHLADLLGDTQRAANLLRVITNPDNAKALAEAMSDCGCLAGSLYCTCPIPKPFDYSGHTPSIVRASI